ncbi:hypothetical protein [Marinicella meishanensis]|uniref:hypothetical protein n=1 Tax=Marinicella meishanensis TaxID=2873263 RepID=UPI001CC1151E|nr:hypothetical protein [Marinicella sp. NBU2979]
MMRIIWVVTLLISLVSESYAGSSTTVTVGPDTDPTCDYNSISAVSFNEPASDFLEIRVSKNYVLDTFQVLSARNTSIRGGFDDCTDETPSGRTVLDGSGFNGAIFLVTESELTGGAIDVLSLVDLEISGGNRGTSGGVMHIAGSWGVELVNVYLHNNSSVGDGGAIFVEPSNNSLVSFPEVFVYGNSILNNNTATNGGAIACDGLAVITVFDTQLMGNVATESGGAIYANNDCIYYQSGAGPLQGIILNEAGFFGGGIYANNHAEISLDSHSVFSSGQAAVISNSAQNGGGIAVAGGASLVASDAIINNNTATSTGGGIRSNNGQVIIQRTLPGAQCHTEDRCSTVSENRVFGSDSSFQGGGAIATFGGTLTVTGTYLEGNSAFHGSAIRARFMPFDSIFTDVTMVGNVFAKNRNASQVVYLDESSAHIGFSTFIDNEDMDRVIEVAYPTTFGDVHEVLVVGSIFYEFNGFTESVDLTTLGADPVGDCNRIDPLGSFALEPRSTDQTPSFVDRAAGDYRLVNTLVDYCDSSLLGVRSNTSANGLARPVDNSRPNLHGSYDLGGLESYPLDLIFADDFD